MQRGGCFEHRWHAAGKTGVVSMSRAWLLLLVIAAYGTSVGCTACGTPYDYCSATFTGRGEPCGDCGDCGTGDCGGGNCGDDCRENVRLGSVFSDNSIRRMSYDEPTLADDAPEGDQQPTEAEELPDPEEQPTLPEVPLETGPSTEDAEEMALPELSDEPTEEPLEVAPPRSSSRPPRTLRR